MSNRTTVKTLDVTQSHQLLDALLIKSGTEKQFRRGLRNYTIALLMFETGIRVGELVKLAWSDLFYNYIPVTSIIIRAEIAKKNKQREVPLSQRLCNALIEYHKHFSVPDTRQPTSFAFHSEDPTRPLTTRTVERFIRKAAIRSIGRPVHPHMLRHTFATRLMRKVDIRTVQVLLGHTNIASTQIYLHPCIEDLKKAIAGLDQIGTPDYSLLHPTATPAGVPNSPDTITTDRDM